MLEASADTTFPTSVMGFPMKPSRVALFTRGAGGMDCAVARLGGAGCLKRRLPGGEAGRTMLAGEVRSAGQKKGVGSWARCGCRVV